ncbi:PKD domain-containing protein [Bacteroidales bacterium AH-315-I05]|nr:PKD domain-containing protein [Bacteroidales bacterium AH-315-I05]
MSCNCLINTSVLVAFFLILNLDSNAQQPYRFERTTGTYTDLSGAVLLNNNQPWDDQQYYIPIGFTFDFFDLNYDSVYVSDYVSFDVFSTYVVDVLYADFVDRDDVNSVSPISYLLIGSAGNRILKIEWKNAGFYCENNGSPPMNDFVNVQLWLYEKDGDIEIHAGPTSVADPQIAYCGEEGPSAALRSPIEKYALIGPAANCIMTNGIGFISGTPANGTIYRFLKCNTPAADFVYSVVDSTITVTFTDSSLNAVAYLWDFGDGQTSTEQNPVHIYSTPGTYTATLTAYANCDTNVVSKTVIILSVGTEQHFITENHFTIYPNPTNGNFNIRMDLPKENKRLRTAQIKISDLTGRMVYEKNMAVTNAQTDLFVNIAELANALYFLQLQTEEFVITKRIVKQ